MEFAAEILSSRAGAGRAYGEQLDDGEVRPSEPTGFEEAPGRWHQAARLLAGDNAGLVQVRDGDLRRNLCDEPQLQQGLCVADRLRQRRILMAVTCRSCLPPPSPFLYNVLVAPP